MVRLDWLRFWLHFTVGVVCAWIAIQDSFNGGLCVLTFLVYEAMNDWRKEDASYKDIFGFSFGLIITFLLIYALT